MNKKIILNTAAITALIGGLGIASPLYAVPTNRFEPPKTQYSDAYDTPGQPVYATTQTVRNDNASTYMTPTERRAAVQKNSSKSYSYNDGEKMQWHVEDRITSLHEKLGITNDQESRWYEVAKVMRINDNIIKQMMSDRHNPNNLNAIADLESYQHVAQAHVEGLQRLIPVFQDLYDDMSDNQQRTADNVFNRFEGHEGRISANMQK